MNKKKHIFFTVDIHRKIDKNNAWNWGFILMLLFDLKLKRYKKPKPKYLGTSS